jgi:predicted lipid carrier protein YhbT
MIRPSDDVELLDYFAGLALQALLDDRDVSLLKPEAIRLMAEQAYAIAEAMLQAREQGQ